MTSESMAKVYKEKESDLRTNLTYLTAKTENAKKENDEILKKVEANQEILKNLEDTVKNEKKAIFDQIAELHQRAKDKDLKAQELLESVIRQKNEVEVLKSQLNSSIQEKQNVISIYTEKYEKLKRVIEEIK